MTTTETTTETIEPSRSRRRRDVPAGFAALGAGALMALSLPPWGWWPLAFVGAAILDRLVAGQPRRSRFARTWIFGFSWLGIGIGWMWHFSMPGYVASVAVYGAYLGLAAMVAPGGRWRRLGLPAALTVAEAIRFAWPFGGVPLASMGMAQVSGPLAEVARLGGPILMTWLTFQIGGGLSALVERRWRTGAIVLVPVAAVVLLGAVAPSGEGTGRTLRVAYVQGGGPQGTRATETSSRDVTLRHLAATRSITGGVDLVLWPENVIDVYDFETSVEYGEVVAEAARLGVPISVGVTEDAGEYFVNAQLMIEPDGAITGRYEKVRRVPFGEYVPLRDLLDRLGAPVDQIARDAEAGTGPAVLPLPGGGNAATVISWEVFFPGRVREGVQRDGQVVLNPTNGSSYIGTHVQTQQVASSRLRALETGRWVVQASPTGFSEFVTPDGTVLDRTAVSEQAVAVREVELRTGETIYVRTGEKPWVALAMAVVALSVVLDRRDRRRAAVDGPTGAGDASGEPLTPPAAR